MTRSNSCNKLSLRQVERRMPNKDQIKYQSDLANISAQSLDGGFFEGWPNPPKPEIHFKHMQQSAYVVLALDSQTKKVVGFISAVSDQMI